MFFAAHHSSPSRENGQVAQLVERSPEKAGVGGSIPSLATICITRSPPEKSTSPENIGTLF